MEGGCCRGVGGGGGEGGSRGGVGVCEGEGGGVGDLFVGGEGGDEERLDWEVCVSVWLWLFGCEGGKGTRTFWRCPGAVVEKGEIQFVVHTAV